MLTVLEYTSIGCPRVFGVADAESFWWGMSLSWDFSAWSLKVPWFSQEWSKDGLMQDLFEEISAP